jgi:hypothetical protein
MNRDALALHLVGTLKKLYAERDISTAKRDERKRRDKQEAMRNLYKVQRRKLEIDEANARSRAKEVDLNALARTKEVHLKQREVDHLTADLTTMPPDRRAWFQKRQK